MTSFFYVALGGALGASARHGLGLWSLRQFGPGFPIGTLLANIIGSALMGLLVGYLAHKGGAGSNNIRLFAGVGLLGGFTTFSAFSLDAINLLQKKAYGDFSLYIGASVMVSLVALLAGLWLARSVFS